MKISTNQFKNGTKLIIDNAPCSIVEHEFHKPGKGQAVVRIGEAATATKLSIQIEPPIKLS